MRIAFDGTTLRPRRTGVGYYTEHLLRHLAQEAADDEIVVLSNRPVDTTAPLPARVQAARSRWRGPSLIWMQASAPRELARLRVDLAHFTNGMMPLLSRTPTVVTIHDMSLSLYPHYHPARRVLLSRPLVDIAARRAAAVITVSESARRDIVRLYDLPPERVHVIHEAPAPSFRRVRDPRELERVRRQYGLGERVILYVGTIEPRKNLPNLIGAFAARRRAGDLTHQLVCVGPYGWLSRGIGKHVERLGVADAVTFTGYVPFDDLPAIYSLAEMFVFPSVYEGFGLPVAEAMACGAPLITGPTEALVEVAAGAVMQVDALDPQALGDGMVALARDPERRLHLAALGEQRARLFSWSRAARETLAVYRTVAKQPAGSPAVEAVTAYARLTGDHLPAHPTAVAEPRQP
jgi:glycosyltransferase involved in cell wall biosynthesis